MDLADISDPEPPSSSSRATTTGFTIADSAPNHVYALSPELGGSWPVPIKGSSVLSQFLGNSSGSPTTIAPQVPSMSPPMTHQNLTPSPPPLPPQQAPKKRTLLGSSQEEDVALLFKPTKPASKFATAPLRSPSPPSKLPVMTKGVKTTSTIRHETSVLRSDLAASKAQKRRLLESQGDAADLTQKPQSPEKPAVEPKKVDTRWTDGGQKKRRLLESQSDHGSAER